MTIHTRVDQPKSGFIYLWFDRAKKMYYSGSHWGYEDDVYICSSNWMKRAYAKRPQDFKRRILARGFTVRLDMLNEEQRWLKMMKEEELGKRYYNLTRLVSALWSTFNDSRKTVAQKIGDGNRGKKHGPHKPETKRKIGDANSKILHTEEWGKKIGIANTGKKRTAEQSATASVCRTQEWADGRRKPFGPMSDAHKKSIGDGNRDKKLPEQQVEQIRERTKCDYLITFSDGRVPLEIRGLKEWAAKADIPFGTLSIYSRSGNPLPKYDIQSIVRLSPPTGRMGHASPRKGVKHTKEHSNKISVGLSRSYLITFSDGREPIVVHGLAPWARENSVPKGSISCAGAYGIPLKKHGILSIVKLGSVNQETIDTLGLAA